MHRRSLIRSDAGCYGSEARLAAASTNHYLVHQITAQGNGAVPCIQEVPHRCTDVRSSDRTPDATAPRPDLQRPRQITILFIRLLHKVTEQSPASRRFLTDAPTFAHQIGRRMLRLRGPTCSGLDKSLSCSSDYCTR